MKYILVCHDTGNTNNLKDTADFMLANANKNDTPEITFLVVGEAAQTIFAANPQHKDRVIYLNDWLKGTTLKNLNDRPLTAAEMVTVKQKLIELNPDKAITTSSCFPTALAPYQISEILTEVLHKSEDDFNNFIFNGDFLQDLTNNPFWVSITGAWAQKVALLVAMAKEQEAVLALAKKQSEDSGVNHDLTCLVVGSSAIDKLYNPSATAAEITAIKQKLAAQDKYLLFISGSKTIDDDLELLSFLDNYMIIDPNTVIRMGLHPGTKDMQDYVTQVVGWLKQQSEFPAKLVITPVVKALLTDTSILDPNYVIEENLKGDEIFSVARAVASAQPTTIVTQAIVSGKPGFCLPRYSNSYLAHFFQAAPMGLINHQQAPQMLPKNEMNMPDEAAVVVIARQLTRRA